MSAANQMGVLKAAGSPASLMAHTHDRNIIWKILLLKRSYNTLIVGPQLSGADHESLPDIQWDKHKNCSRTIFFSFNRYSCHLKIQIHITLLLNFYSVIQEFS